MVPPHTPGTDLLLPIYPNYTFQSPEPVPMSPFRRLLASAQFIIYIDFLDPAKKDFNLPEGQGHILSFQGSLPAPQTQVLLLDYFCFCYLLTFIAYFIPSLSVTDSFATVSLPNFILFPDSMAIAHI